MKKIYVYLGGPITGIKYKKAESWRKLVKDRLPRWIVAVSPMRHENPLARGKLGVIKNQPEEYVLRYQRRITSSCRNDVKKCDILFLNLLGIKMVSIGTMIEIGWGDILKKSTVLVMKKSNVHHHIMTREIPDAVVPNLEEGINAVIKIAKRLQKRKLKLIKRPKRKMRLNKLKSKARRKKISSN